MVKPRRSRTSKALRETFAFLICCVSVRKPKDVRARVKNHEKVSDVNCSEGAVSFRDELYSPHLIDHAVKHKQDYPEHLNPFANDTDENIFIDIQERNSHSSVCDYPEYLNTFSDDDDDDGGGGDE